MITLEFRDPIPQEHLVEAIRLVRSVAITSLADCKNFLTGHNGGVGTFHTVNAEDSIEHKNGIQNLRTFGITVTTEAEKSAQDTDKVIQDIRKLVLKLVELGSDEMAADLLLAISSEKHRRNK